MSGPIRKIVHALKYGGWEIAATPMADRMAVVSLPPDVSDEARLIVPVPTTAARLRERGYNQVERLASEYAIRTGRTLDGGILERVSRDATQTALHPDERRANVARAFAVRPAACPRLLGEHVLLIDDVRTTGATSLACASALCSAGARAVSIVTFARTMPELERNSALG